MTMLQWIVGELSKGGVTFGGNVEAVLIGFAILIAVILAIGTGKTEHNR